MLFYRSIADNLRVGKPDATDAELEEAARLACAHDFILLQPRGYQTRIGERGSTLSGGERQRLAIAACCSRTRPSSFWTEATSALDAATEAQVQQALKTLKQGAPRSSSLTAGHHPGRGPDPGIPERPHHRARELPGSGASGGYFAEPGGHSVPEPGGKRNRRKPDRDDVSTSLRQHVSRD